MIGVRNRLVDSISKSETLIPGRAQRILLKHNEININLINIYAPAKTQYRKAFFEEFFEKIKNLKNRLIIGDWNCISQKEETNRTFVRHPYITVFKDNLVSQHLEDIHVLLNRGNIKYTFTGTNGRRSRLDKAISDNQITKRIVSYKIIPNTFSDHEGIKILIDLDKNNQWGKGTWKLNTSILTDEPFREKILDLINLYQINKGLEGLTIQDQWDKLKIAIKKEAIFYSVKKNKQEKQLEFDLRQEMEFRQGEIDQDANVDENTERLEEIKLLLSDMENKIFEGARIRAKLDKFEKNEKPTRYFFSKEKSRGDAKQIRSLIDENNYTLTDEHEIIEEVETFYQTLYRSEGLNDIQAQENLGTIKSYLNDEDRDFLNSPITELEIRKAIKEMKPEKSPGDDGLPADFYKCFLDDLIETLVELFNNIRLSTIFPKSQKNAIIKLLYKKGDHRLLKNWRPVSLLNCDYKIMSKIMTGRLSKFMDKLTPIEQKCGVVGRQIRDIIRNLDTVLDDMEEEGGYLILLDQQKAFDRVNHKYMFMTLEKMGIKGKFLSMIRSMYSDMSSQICINGRLTNHIDIQRSIRQGCPFSMLIFVLTQVPLIHMINNEPQLKGFLTKRNRRLKIQCFADDNTIIIREPSEYKVIQNIYSKHSIASEAKLNLEKTEILKIGQKNNYEDDEFRARRKKTVKILGTLFTENRADQSSENNNKVYDIAENLLERIKGRHLSIIGKVLYVNSKIWSLLWHKAWVLNEKEAEMKKLIDRIISFLTSLKKKKTFNTITLPKELGGLGLINPMTRIPSIKIKALENVGLDYVENDMLQYEIGHRMADIYGYMPVGPKREIHVSRYETVINTFKQNIDKLQNITELKVKDIENKIFDPGKIEVCKNVWLGKISKHHAINYRIATDIMPILPGICVLCKSNADSIEHILLECDSVSPIREKIKEWLTLLRGKEVKIDNSLMITSESVKDELEHFILSEMKIATWHMRNKVKFENKNFNHLEIIKSVEAQLRFRIIHFDNG